MTDEADTGSPTVLYNGACPVCGTEIRHCRRRCEKAGIVVDWRDITDETATLQRLGIDREEAKKRLHVIGPDGTLHIGVAAFLAIWPTVPGYAWLGRLVGLPGIRPCAEAIYNRILAPALYAWNRYRGR